MGPARRTSGEKETPDTPAPGASTTSSGAECSSAAEGTREPALVAATCHGAGDAR